VLPSPSPSPSALHPQIAIRSHPHPIHIPSHPILGEGEKKKPSGPRARLRALHCLDWLCLSLPTYFARPSSPLSITSLLQFSATVILLLPYNLKTPTHFVSSATHFPIVKNKRENPPFWSPIPAFGVPLPQPAPLRCKAFAIVNPISLSSPLLSSRLVSHLCGVGFFVRVGVIGIYHTAGHYILQRIDIDTSSITLFDSNSFDSAVHRGCSQPTSASLERPLFLLVDRFDPADDRPAPPYSRSSITSDTQLRC